MKSNINVKGSTFVATIAGLLLTGASIVSFVTSDSKGVKSFSLNFGLLSLGVTVGSVAASNLMATKVLDENEKITNKFTDDIKELDRANSDLKTRLASQKSKLSEHETKVNELEQLVIEKDVIVKNLKIAFENLQRETAIKQRELDDKLARENTDRADLYTEILNNFSSDLNYKIDESYNGLARSVEAKLNNPKHEELHVRLREFWHKLSGSLANTRKLLIDLKNSEFSTTELTDIYFQISDEIAARKVQYRNLLNTVERLTLKEFEEELRERRNPKNFVPANKVMTALDNNDNYYVNQKVKFQSALNQQVDNLNNLRENVTDLINQIDEKNLEIANLKSEINQNRKPLKWTLANSRELEIGNMIIDYFWKEGTGYYLDRSFMETDGYESKIYFQIDRNPRQIVETELNERSEELQQFCRVIKPITFSYSGSKGLMVAKVVLRERPKTETSQDTIRRICKPHDLFKAAVGGYERWRVTGGSQAGKSPTAQFIADAITAYNSKEVKVRLFNPQYGSKKDNWVYKAEGKNAEECLEGFKTLGREIKQRQAKKLSTEIFDLFIFDELDSVIEELGSAPVRSPLLYAVKQASHQDVGIVIIGQSSAANVVSKMTWSDWNSTAQCHIGENAKLFIENRWKNEPEKREEYLKQYETIRNYYESKNNENGLTISDYGYFRFAFIAIPNQRPYFIELPPFLFLPDSEPEVTATAHENANTELNCSPTAQNLLPKCPHCGNTEFTGNGKGRVKCKGCGKSSSKHKLIY
jgi:peptidoglycan hydrolase CwlO-like protein/ribosomal protein S27E